MSVVSQRLFVSFFNGLSGSEGKQVGLEMHNKYRRIHNAPPMQLSPDLNDGAQRWADKLARESKLEHSGTTEQGENLALQCESGTSDAALMKKAVKSW